MAIIVLCYHNFYKYNGYSSWMKVNITSFEKQILAIKKIGKFINPHELFSSDVINSNRMYLLLSFDDGFYNNYLLGYPIIKKYEIPALFFISTWNMETGQTFWFDRIIQPIQRYNLASLDLRDLGLDNYLFPCAKGETRWSNIHALLEDVKRFEVRQDGSIIESVVEKLHVACKKKGEWKEDYSCQPINADQVKEMRRSGLCYFGSHSHRHVILNKISDEMLQYELTTSRNKLQEILGERICHISYPNGDVDDRVQKACQDAGYSYGFITTGGSFKGTADRMRIPRILIGGFDSTPKFIWKVFKALI